MEAHSRRFLIASVLLLLVAWLGCKAIEQRADTSFDVSVHKPALRDKQPRVLIDQAHRNFHTMDARYGPFAELIGNDGGQVKNNEATFSASSLSGADILVIANAKSASDAGDQPAFTGDECKAVVEWVGNGGSLLLVADHYPFGPAASHLSSLFGVEMSGGGTQDSVAYDHTTKADWTQLEFSNANGLLPADHPIIRGRDRSETVHSVVTFWGQSLSVPDSAASLLKLSPSAEDLSAVVTVEKDGNDTRVNVNYANPKPAADRAQGVALEFGKGRVVILGEAAMITAQVDREGRKFGMNIGHGDNRQFALNIVRWLARAL